MDKLHLDQHISHQFNKELEDIRNKVLKMGGLVEQQVNDGLQALLEADHDLATEVAEKLGRFTRDLTAQSSDMPGYRKELRHLGELVKTMLHDTLDAFARMDFEAALQIAARDDDVNREYKNLERLLGTHLVEDPRQVSNLFKITWCARALERIGDHSVNICEYVVYLVKGRDIRHTNFDQVRSEIMS